MRVGIDVSPLVQTRAGTARYVAHLLAELPELEQLRFDGRGRLATAHDYSKRAVGPASSSLPL